jgi:hypothetical protein
VIGLVNQFRVDIQRSKDVYDLKKDIVQERPNAFKDIDPADLILYKVQIPGGEGIKQAALQAPKERLLESQKFSQVFEIIPSVQVVSILVEVSVIGE